ncbi:UDP-N-acetylmuramoyl-tripeptide--D-alanyl-D-alanine ligase [Urechidicola sp. KH5]
MTINTLHEKYSQYYLVDTDTRNIRKNTIFFALKGNKFNGNKFAQEAIKKGAKYAVIDDPRYASDNTILVDDVLETLQELAKYHRIQLDIPIISLTGSNGKTTTKELIASVLKQKYKVTATKGNLNNHIGVPLTLLSMTPATEIGIVEMGANHQKEIEFLCSIALPNFGYITNFGKAHLEGFGGVDGVIKGKSELYDYLRAANGTVFVNSNDEIQIKQSKGILNIVSFEPTLEYLEANPFVKLYFHQEPINSNLIGSYNYNNIAAALTIGNHFKVDIEKAKAAISNYTPSNNRSQIIEKNNFNIVLDAYNANPSSMEVALKNYALNNPNGSIILGDMFELGNSSLKEHQATAELAVFLGFKNIALVGQNFYRVRIKKALKFERFEDFIKSDAFKQFQNQPLFIKGSRGMALERTLDFL